MRKNMQKEKTQAQQVIDDLHNQANQLDKMAAQLRSNQTVPLAEVIKSINPGGKPSTEPYQPFVEAGVEEVAVQCPHCDYGQLLNPLEWTDAGTFYSNSGYTNTCEKCTKSYTFYLPEVSTADNFISSQGIADIAKTAALKGIDVKVDNPGIISFWVGEHLLAGNINSYTSAQSRLKLIPFLSPSMAELKDKLSEHIARLLELSEVNYSNGNSQASTSYAICASNLFVILQESGLAEAMQYSLNEK